MGVARQYCGVVGKKANGQVMVTLHYADPYHAWPISGQLYLPDEWASDKARCQSAAIPKTVGFQTKPELALALIDEARDWDVPVECVTSDGGYGDNPTFLDGLEARGLHYVVGVHVDFGVRLPQEVVTAASQPLPPKKRGGRQRTHPHPVNVAPKHRADEVIAGLTAADWQTITWRRGSDGALTKQFAAVRAHRAVSDQTGIEGWLIGERPLSDQDRETRLCFSDLPADTPLARLVELAHRRPTIERGYEDGKSFLGLDDYTARKWDSFHHHLAIQMLVLSFLTLQKEPLTRPVIQVEPQQVSSPNEPVFPLRPPRLHQHRLPAASDQRIPPHRGAPVADPDRPDRSQAASGPAPLRRLRG